MNFPANSFGRSPENWASPSLRSGESLNLPYIYLYDIYEKGYLLRVIIHNHIFIIIHFKYDYAEK
jgi:hypothetical protein